MRAKKFEEVLCRQRQTRAKVPEQKNLKQKFGNFYLFVHLMTSTNDEFMILMVDLSTHFFDKMTTLAFGMQRKKRSILASYATEL